MLRVSWTNTNTWFLCISCIRSNIINPTQCLGTHSLPSTGDLGAPGAYPRVVFFSVCKQNLKPPGQFSENMWIFYLIVATVWWQYVVATVNGDVTYDVVTSHKAATSKMKPRERGEPLPPSLVLSGRRLFWPLAVAVALVAWAGGVGAADLVIRIPGDLSQQDGFYRLDYRDVNNRKIRYCRDHSPLVARSYVDVQNSY